MASPVSKERSRSSRAIGFRSPRGTCSRPTPISRSPRNCWSIWAGSRLELLCAAATKTTCTSPTAPTISGPERRRAMRWSIWERVTRCTGGWNCSSGSTICSIGNTTRPRNSVRRDSQHGQFHRAPVSGGQTENSPSSKRHFSRPARPGAWGGIRLRF